MVKVMKNKEKYNLNKLEIKTTETFGGYKIEVFCEDKVIYKRIYLIDNDSKKIKGFFKWLEEEYKPPILDDVEKAYLSAVIKPFRKNIKYIAKYTFSIEAEYVKICLNCNDYIVFPNFKKGKMYKGMKTNKEYTLEELGL